MSRIGQRRIAPVVAVRSGVAIADRAQDRLVQAVNEVSAGVFAQAIPLEVELAEGLNKIGHGLGRRVNYFGHSCADASGAVITSRQSDNPNPEQSVWVVLHGTTSAKLLLFLFPAVN